MRQTSLPTSMTAAVANTLDFSTMSATPLRATSIVHGHKLSEQRLDSTFDATSIQTRVMTVVIATSAKCLPLTSSPRDVATSMPSEVTLTASPTSTQIKHKFLVVRSDV